MIARAAVVLPLPVLPSTATCVVIWSSAKQDRLLAHRGGLAEPDPRGVEGESLRAGAQDVGRAGRRRGRECRRALEHGQRLGIGHRRDAGHAVELEDGAHEREVGERAVVALPGVERLRVGLGDDARGVDRAQLALLDHHGAPARGEEFRRPAWRSSTWP